MSSNPLDCRVNAVRAIAAIASRAVQKSSSLGRSVGLPTDSIVRRAESWSWRVRVSRQRCTAKRFAEGVGPSGTSPAFRSTTTTGPRADWSGTIARISSAQAASRRWYGRAAPLLGCRSWLWSRRKTTLPKRMRSFVSTRGASTRSESCLLDWDFRSSATSTTELQQLRSAQRCEPSSTPRSISRPSPCASSDPNKPRSIGCVTTLPDRESPKSSSEHWIVRLKQRVLRGLRLSREISTTAEQSRRRTRLLVGHPHGAAERIGHQLRDTSAPSVGFLSRTRSRERSMKSNGAQ